MGGYLHTILMVYAKTERIITARTKHARIVATIIPRPINTLYNGFLVDFINTNERNPMNPLIPPPIAPPTTGNISQRDGTLLQNKINTKPIIARAYSYHFALGVNCI